MIVYSLRLLKIVITLLCVSNSFAGNVYAEKMKIAFINPTYHQEPFWEILTDFMRSATKDLDVDLQVYYSNSNRFKSLDIAKEILQSPNKPDYLVFHFQAQIGSKILQMAEDAKIHTFVINTDAPKSDIEAIGKPRDKYKYWLGHLKPNDHQAGYLLASALVDKAIQLKKVAKDGKVHIIGLTGTTDNTASANRNSGLKEFVDQRPSVLLHQVINAAWDADKAKNVTKILMARYPETSVIWSASDEMSLGAIRSLKEQGIQPGIDVLVGGIDGTLKGLNAVTSGEMVATISGHFIEGAWATVLLYDHHHGVDFENDTGLVMHTNMQAIQANNIKCCLDLLSTEYIDQIDFKSFSKIANPKLERYDFILPDLFSSN